MNINFTDENVKNRIKKILSSLGKTSVFTNTYGDKVYVEYYLDDKPLYHKHIGGFSIDVVDGGQGLFFGNVWLETRFRNMGFGVKLHALRLELAKEAGAIGVIATSRKDNDNQNRIFEKFGWNKGQLDDNHYIWFKDIQKYKVKSKIG